MEIPCVVWCCQYMEGGDVYNVSTVTAELRQDSQCNPTRTVLTHKNILRWVIDLKMTK